ncbi:MAG: hypothetical protein J6K82_00960 [Alphaproteobacteria bacterium]|nr:hypothetical protein [Alphaproteobacteria bacterium]
MANVKKVLADTVKYGVPVAVAVLIILSMRNCDNINSLREDANQNRQENVARDSVISELRDGTEHLRERIVVVEKRVGAVEGRVDSLENRVDSLENRVDSIKSCECKPVVPVVAPVAPVAPRDTVPAAKKENKGDEVVVEKRNKPVVKDQTPVYKDVVVVEVPETNPSSTTVVVEGANNGNIVTGNNNNTVNGDNATIIVVQEAAPQPTSSGSVTVRHYIRRERTR